MNVLIAINKCLDLDQGGCSDKCVYDGPGLHHCQSSIPLAVVGAGAGGGLVLIVIFMLLVVIVLRRRKRIEAKNQEVAEDQTFAAAVAHLKKTSVIRGEADKMLSPL